jgi:hypothetical protein
MRLSPIILIVLTLGLAATKSQLGISDEIFREIMGVVVGALSQQGVTKVRKIHAAKKAAAPMVTP